MANPNIVNVSSILGNTFVSTLVTTANTTLVVNSVSSGKVFKINSILASNTLASSATAISIAVNDGSNSESIATNISIPAASTLVVIDKNSSFYLTEGYSINGSSTTSSSIDLLISYEEIN
jgi:hypothetical protein